MRGERGKRPNQRQEACSRLVPDKPLRSLNMKPSSQQNVGHFGVLWRAVQNNANRNTGSRWYLDTIYSLSGQLGRVRGSGRRRFLSHKLTFQVKFSSRLVYARKKGA